MQIQESIIQAIQELTRALRDHNNQNETQSLVREVLKKQEVIISAISDFATSVQTAFAAVDADLDSIIAGIANLDALITQLQNSPGGITPADQALLDQIQTTVQGLKTKADSVNVTPPPAPGT